MSITLKKSTTPVYKKIYSYVCDTCSVYKKALAEYITNSTEYLRLKLRNHPICSGDQPIHREFLEKIFKQKIDKNDKPKYRKKFLKNCQELMDMLEDEKHVGFTFDKLYSIIPREQIISDNIPLEMIINFIYFFVSLNISWSDYLLAYPSGQKLISDVFLAPKKTIAIANILAIVKSVYTMSGKNEYLFKKELFSIFPNIQQLIQGTVFEQSFILWITNQISTKVFINTIDLISI